jgi:hypothetical protein
MNPRVRRDRLTALLAYQPLHLPWAGADLFHVATAGGARQMVIIETNSSPSGQKSMPLLTDSQDEGGYRRLVERTFLPRMKGRRLPNGGLAVLWDKNPMEASGYAATIAECTGEPVFYVSCFDGDPDPSTRFVDGLLEVRDVSGTWHPIRAAFRYVTQRPWNRIPVVTKTMLLNPLLACLAGGRNKLLAAKAYDLLNAELLGSGLEVKAPETFWDVSHPEIPLSVRRLGGLAVVKVPYSNAGQGVCTITNDAELADFMKRHQHYSQFIVQSLIGNYHWSSIGRAGRLFHVGTLPSKRAMSYVADLRMMISATPDGFRPLAIYARRSRRPLTEHLNPDIPSWDVLGTNLSIRRADGSWDSDTNRLLIMDRRDFNLLGIGIDDLVEAFVQTVLASVAIDKLAIALTTQKGRFRRKLFSSLDKDPVLLGEIRAD